MKEVKDKKDLMSENFNREGLKELFKDLASHNYKQDYQNKLIKDFVDGELIKRGVDPERAKKISMVVCEGELDIGRQKLTTKTKLKSAYDVLQDRIRNKADKEIEKINYPIKKGDNQDEDRNKEQGEKEKADQNSVAEENSKELDKKHWEFKFPETWLRHVGSLPENEAQAMIEKEIRAQGSSQGFTAEDFEKTIKHLYSFSAGRITKVIFNPPKKLIDALKESFYEFAQSVSLESNEQKLEQFLDSLRDPKVKNDPSKIRILNDLLMTASPALFKQLAKDPRVIDAIGIEQIRSIGLSRFSGIRKEHVAGNNNQKHGQNDKTHENAGRGEDVLNENERDLGEIVPEEGKATKEGQELATDLLNSTEKTAKQIEEIIDDKAPSKAEASSEAQPAKEEEKIFGYSKEECKELLGIKDNLSADELRAEMEAAIEMGLVRTFKR